MQRARRRRRSTTSPGRGDRKPGADGKLPPVGNTVDVAERDLDQHDRRSGADRGLEGSGLRSRSSAPSTTRRVIEIPTPRWTAYDAKYFGIKMPAGRADDRSGARLHVADLVHATDARRLAPRAAASFPAARRGCCSPLYGLVPPDGAPGSRDRIVVTQGRSREHGARTFTARLAAAADARRARRRWCDDWMRDEVYYREARRAWASTATTASCAAGCSRSSSSSSRAQHSAEPTEDELAGIPRRSRRRLPDRPAGHVPPSLSWPPAARRQVGNRRHRDAGRARKAGAEADVGQFGDPSLIEQAFKDASTTEIGKQFGAAFAAKLSGLPVGQWQGPVESPFGLHLVLIEARRKARCHLSTLCAAPCGVPGPTDDASMEREVLSLAAANYTVTVEKPEMKALLVLLAMVCASAAALAHEVRPAYLQFRETAPDTYDVLWKVPGYADEFRRACTPSFPPVCTRSARRAANSAAALHRALVGAPAGRADRRHDPHRRARDDAHGRAGPVRARRRHGPDSAACARRTLVHR